jgi:hypothetical protein
MGFLLLELHPGEERGAESSQANEVKPIAIALQRIRLSSSHALVFDHNDD